MPDDGSSIVDIEKKEEERRGKNNKYFLNLAFIRLVRYSKKNNTISIQLLAFPRSCSVNSNSDV